MESFHWYMKEARFIFYDQNQLLWTMFCESKLNYEAYFCLSLFKILFKLTKIMVTWKWSESHSVMSSSLWPHRLYSLWNSPSQNTGVGSLSLLQGIFPTQELNQASCIAGGFFTSWATKEAPLATQGHHQSCMHGWKFCLKPINSLRHFKIILICCGYSEI